MNKDPVIRFEKVSFDEYKKMFEESEEPLSDDEIKAIRESYDAIKLPRRATSGSAGYDFYMPFDMCFDPEASESVMIPSGIRCYMNGRQVLLIVPRSGLGSRYGFRLVNTIAVIDSDYYGAKNEGHILLNITADKPFNLHAGDAYAQGLLFEYFTTTNDQPIHAQRVGGFGSTNK